MLYMLDTNTVSYLVQRRSARLKTHIDRMGPRDRLSISVITEAEVRYGVALKPEAHRLAREIEFVLAGLDILPWTSDAAAAYGDLRAANSKRGLAAGSLDLLIAAHALAVQATLVTSDAALPKLVGGPVTVNWATDLRPN
jgi:tRNA(fMet)-specific endonuclease VapC